MGSFKARRSLGFTGVSPLVMDGSPFFRFFFSLLFFSNMENQGSRKGPRKREIIKTGGRVIVFFW